MAQREAEIARLQAAAKEEATALEAAQELRQADLQASNERRKSVSGRRRGRGKRLQSMPTSFCANSIGRVTL